jgi:hypothetical protein
MLQERQSRILLTNFVETEEDIRMENGAYVRRVTSPREENPYLNPKSDLNAILREIRKITAKCKREDEDLELKGEWRFAAMVLDRKYYTINYFKIINPFLCFILTMFHSLFRIFFFSQQVLSLFYCLRQYLLFSYSSFIVVLTHMLTHIHKLMYAE